MCICIVSNCKFFCIPAKCTFLTNTCYSNPTRQNETRKATRIAWVYRSAARYNHHKSGPNNRSPRQPMQNNYRLKTLGGFPKRPLSRYIQAALTIHPPPRFSPPQTCAQITPRIPYPITRAASTHAVRSNRSRRKPANDARRVNRARHRREAHSLSQARWASSQKTGSWPADSWTWPKTWRAGRTRHDSARRFGQPIEKMGERSRWDWGGVWVTRMSVSWGMVPDQASW
jgi:hypothetical protein